MFKGLKLFKKELKNEAKRIPKEGTVAVGRIAVDLFNDIVIRTPKDTGFMSSKWAHTINRRPPHDVILNPRGGTYSPAKAPAAARFAIGDTMYIYNNVAYARKIEAGWSKKAPRNFVRNAVQRADRKLQAAFRQIK